MASPSLASALQGANENSTRTGATNSLSSIRNLPKGTGSHRMGSSRSCLRPNSSASLVILIAITPSAEDVRGTVPARVADHVGPRRAVRLLAEIDEEVRIDLHPPLLGVAVDLEQVRALFGQVRIELVVPHA